MIVGLFSQHKIFKKINIPIKHCRIDGGRFMQVNYIRIFLMGSGKGVRFRQVTILGVRFIEVILY